MTSCHNTVQYVSVTCLLFIGGDVNTDTGHALILITHYTHPHNHSDALWS